MSWSPKEASSIQHHMSVHNCMVQLSLRPHITFKDKESGAVHDIHIIHLVTAYETHLKDQRAEKTRKDRELKRNEKLHKPAREQYQ
jgi:hypothetical protein